VAFNWRNGATPYKYAPQGGATVNVANDFTISGGCVRSEGNMAIEGDMVVGVSGGATNAASSSAYVFDRNNANITLTVGGDLTIYEDSYLGNGGFNYEGEGGYKPGEGTDTGYWGSSVGRRGSIIVSGTLLTLGVLGIGSGSNWVGGSEMDGSEVFRVGHETTPDAAGAFTIQASSGAVLNEYKGYVDMRGYSGSMHIGQFMIGSDAKTAGTFYSPDSEMRVISSTANGWLWRQDPGAWYFNSKSSVYINPQRVITGFAVQFYDNDRSERPYNMTFSGAAGTSVQYSWPVENNFRIISGKIAPGYSWAEIDVGGNFTLESDGELELATDSNNPIGGNWINNGGTVSNQ